jgi:hypothetical protein
MIVTEQQKKKDQFDAITRMPCEYYYIRVQNPHIGGSATHWIKVTEAQLEAIRRVVCEDA